MPRREKPGATPPMRACCMVSEMLEEAGLDRQKARQLRRQLLEGMILLCRWQLERMDASAPPPTRKGARKVDVQ
jgi:hypothetical protein